MLQAEVEESVTDLTRFNAVVKLVAFSPFKSGTNALDNINSISEGMMKPDEQVLNFPALIIYLLGTKGGILQS